MDVGAIQFIDFVVADNELAGLEMKSIKGTGWDKEDRGAAVINAAVIGRSKFSPANYETSGGIVSILES